MAAWKSSIAIAALLAWPLATLSPAIAHAQGGGRSMDIDTSIRASGMGGASAGVTWGDPSLWGNIASLSRVQGLRYDIGRTQLVPGLAADVHFDSDRWSAGEYGVGVTSMGNPTGLGKLRLDYGLSDETDESGNVVSTFSAYEKVSGAGIAVSLPQVVDNVMALKGRESHLSRAFDLSLGLLEKHTNVAFAPSSFGGTAEADTRDWGVQARLSPLELLHPAEGAVDPRRWLLLDIGYGSSVLNANGASFVFFQGEAEPSNRMERSGVAMRVGYKLPEPRRDGLAERFLQGFAPLVTLGYARDHDRDGTGGTGEYTYEVEQSGFELVLANVLTLRHGQWTDDVGDIDGPTTGWGFGVPIGPWAGFRYDEATVPQARQSGLPDVKRYGWTAWVDPMQFIRDRRAQGAQ